MAQRIAKIEDYRPTPAQEQTRTFERIPIRNLVVDSTYQRAPSPDKIASPHDRTTRALSRTSGGA